MNVITNPYTGDAVESVPFLTQDEAVGALTSLAEEQKAWAAKPLVERIAAVQAGATFIEENVAAIAAAMTATVGILCWKQGPHGLVQASRAAAGAVRSVGRPWALLDGGSTCAGPAIWPNHPGPAVSNTGRQADRPVQGRGRDGRRQDAHAVRAGEGLGALAAEGARWWKHRL